MHFVGKNIRLSWKISSTGINKINTRKSILLSNLLGTQVFLDCHWVVRTPFYGGIIGHNHAFPPLNPSNSRHNTPTIDNFLLIQLMPSQGAQFQERGTLVQQKINPLSCQELSFRRMPLHSNLSATF
uniref:Uncharacterized protein n=1 Tax=Lutzomyia longipalpis TaxID=7200 RepID=A0A1B0CDN5_LUTLO